MKETNQSLKKYVIIERLLRKYRPEQLMDFRCFDPPFKQDDVFYVISQLIKKRRVNYS